MCCLFGFVDYKHNMKKSEKDRLLRILSVACEARGTDATGIAYMKGNRMRILKKPKAAHEIKFSIPEDVYVVMGHTRMTTQGAASKNYNNHPFHGVAGGEEFAFAHNGCLYNEDEIRQTYDIEPNQIETDSYVVAQALESKGKVDFSSLAEISEKVDGSFCFTALTQEQDLYIIKGDNPMCIYHFPKKGIYVYASTELILASALKAYGMLSSPHEEIKITDGQIIKIQPDGKTEFAEFTMPVSYGYYGSWWRYNYRSYNYDGYDDQTGLYDLSAKDEDYSTYYSQLVDLAVQMGFDEETVRGLLNMGYSLEDIEDYLYDAMYPRRYFYGYDENETDTGLVPATI